MAALKLQRLAASELTSENPVKGARNIARRTLDPVEYRAVPQITTVAGVRSAPWEEHQALYQENGYAGAAHCLSGGHEYHHPLLSAPAPFS
jgi:hypothetical protein